MQLRLFIYLRHLRQPVTVAAAASFGLFWTMRQYTLAAASLWVFLTTSWCFSGASALESDLYFYLAEKAPRCFVEEIPEDLMVIGEYKHADAKTKYAVIKIYDAQGDEVYQEAAEATGRFAYPARASGEHVICVQSDRSKTSWPRSQGPAKFHLKLEIHGKDSEINEHVAKKEHLTKLEREIEELDSKVDVILKDIAYSREQEKHFRDQGERINSRIMWWSLFQTLLLLLSGVWQIIHLKNFFRAKKLV